MEEIVVALRETHRGAGRTAPFRVVGRRSGNGGKAPNVVSYPQDWIAGATSAADLRDTDRPQRRVVIRGIENHLGRTDCGEWSHASVQRHGVEPGGSSEITAPVSATCHRKACGSAAKATGPTSTT